jgi:uncharacterized protein
LKKAVILHGTEGSPELNWFRWLETELKNRGYEVWLPLLPHPEKPSLREWTDYLKTNAPFPIDNDTLLIGHSSGAILALITAQESTVKIGGVVAVAVFHDNSLNWDANSRLFDVDFDFPSIKSKTTKLLFVHSDDDPYVPLDQAKYVADNCDAETVVIKGQGHFNLEKSPKFKTFPELIDLMEERLTISRIT